jgi:hypothetical protein
MQMMVGLEWLDGVKIPLKNALRCSYSLCYGGFVLTFRRRVLLPSLERLNLVPLNAELIRRGKLISCIGMFYTICL